MSVFVGSCVWGYRRSVCCCGSLRRLWIDSGMNFGCIIVICGSVVRRLRCCRSSCSVFCW